ncbi:MAG TPA: nucleoside hydrolase [Tepidisphaeraceae bacterium]
MASAPIWQTNLHPFIFRRMTHFFATGALLMMLVASVGCADVQPSTQSQDLRIPVILDTDIGDDIDDTWALLMLLKSPQFDVKLITTTNGQQDYRARLIAKILTAAGRTDIPIGLGAGESRQEQKQLPWVQDFPLSQYTGKVHGEGAAAMVDTIKSSKEPLTVIAIGPVQTVAAALERDPAIAPMAHYIGMQGSVANPVAEFNVKSSVASAQKVFSANWKSATITPLDTCGQPDVSIAGERFQSLKDSNDPLVKILLENYAIWSKQQDPMKLTKSTTLYDTVAICLADPEGRRRLNLQNLKLRVTDEGVTKVDDSGAPITAAMSWNDLGGFRDHIISTLLKPKR